MNDKERCSIVVVLRDRFSTTERCLDDLLKNTPGGHELIAVFGGTPDRIRKRLESRYSEKVRFIFEPELLNPSEYRNIGLRAASQRLAVLMDNDVYVRPGWLEPLVRCQLETGAAMVVPIVLERGEKIHTAGNDLIITYKDGVAWGQKYLRFCRVRIYPDGNNLRREPTDYGELHCQLMDRETAVRLGVYDEHLREAGEVDSGLAWAKAGHTMFFEPASTVFYDVPERIDRVEDIRPFIFKWDMNAILKGYIHFRKKWNIDITECGEWQKFNAMFNDKLGLLSRLAPSAPALAVDNAYYIGKRSLSQPFQWWRNAKKAIFGFYRWK